LGEIHVEELGGLGFGITTLLGLSVLAIALGSRRRHSSRTAASSGLVARLVCITPWLSLFTVMIKLSFDGAVR
jgi:hypothetical protein